MTPEQLAKFKQLALEHGYSEDEINASISALEPPSSGKIIQDKLAGVGGELISALRRKNPIVDLGLRLNQTLSPVVNPILSMIPTGKDVAKKIGVSDEPVVSKAIPALKGTVLDASPAFGAGVLFDLLAGKALTSGIMNFGPTIAQDLATLHMKPTARMKKAFGGKSGLRKISQEVLDAGAIEPFKTSETTLLNLEDLLDSVGATKGDITKASTTKIDPLKVAQRFENEVISKYRGNSEMTDIVAGLEKRKNDFLNMYAPGHESGFGKGTPTVISRKFTYSKNLPKPDFSEGLKQIGTKGIKAGLFPNNIPVTSYVTPNKKIFPKQMIETRIEGLPARPKPSMSPSQIEELKTTVMNKINYMADPKAKSIAEMEWASLLKNIGEKAINTPEFLRSKEAYGNLSNALAMVDKSSNLQGGGLVNRLGDLEVFREAFNLAKQGNPASIALPIGRGITKGRTAGTLAFAMDKIAKAAATPEGQRNITALLPLFNMLKEE